MKNPLQLSHEFLSEVLTKDSIAIDATMGNGHDTLFLAQQSQKVYAFDIQEKAIENTQQLLEKSHVSNACLILDGHEQLDQYVTEKITAAIFNLGYLPSADKNIITKPETTIIALQKILHHLKVGGRVSLMIYYGHEGGQTEKEAVVNFVTKLNQQQFTVMLYKSLNQVHYPPFLIMIEKHHI